MPDNDLHSRLIARSSSIHIFLFFRKLKNEREKEEKKKEMLSSKKKKNYLSSVLIRVEKLTLKIYFSLFCFPLFFYLLDTSLFHLA